jgi:TM2 domain-containing membrane protein YozV
LFVGAVSLVANQPKIVVAPDGQQINLKDPLIAGVLAWLIPGLGHLYQGRTAKGIIFFTCILGTFAYGVFIGGSQVVYASIHRHDFRLHYVGQVMVGLPALPAAVQCFRAERGQAPLWDGWMAPPSTIPRNGRMSELDQLYDDPTRDFDLGSTFAAIAGLLNVLAIYDAARGPMFMPPEESAKKKKKSAGEPSETESTGS